MYIGSSSCSAPMNFLREAFCRHFRVESWRSNPAESELDRYTERLVAEDHGATMAQAPEGSSARDPAQGEVCLGRWDPPASDQQFVEDGDRSMYEYDVSDYDVTLTHIVFVCVLMAWWLYLFMYASQANADEPENGNLKLTIAKRVRSYTEYQLSHYFCVMR